MGEKDPGSEPPVIGPGKLHVTDHNVDGSASIDKVYDTPERLGVEMNMTGPLSDAVAEAHRTITLVDRKDLMVVDAITAKPGMDAYVEWRMLTQASGSIKSNRITLSRSGKKMYLYAMTSTGTKVTYQVWPSTRESGWGVRPWDVDTSESVVGYTFTVPAGKTILLTTYLSETQP